MIIDRKEFCIGKNQQTSIEFDCRNSIVKKSQFASDLILEKCICRMIRVQNAHADDVL